MKKKAERLPVSAFVGAAERRLAEPESGVGHAVECQQLRIGSAARGGEQLSLLTFTELELGDRARDVPCDILAADEIVSLVVIDRIRLEQTAVREP